MHGISIRLVCGMYSQRFGINILVPWSYFVLIFYLFIIQIENQAIVVL